MKGMIEIRGQRKRWFMFEPREKIERKKIPQKHI